MSVLTPVVPNLKASTHTKCHKTNVVRHKMINNLGKQKKSNAQCLFRVFSHGNAFYSITAFLTEFYILGL